MKKNIENKWWNDFVVKRLDCVGLESSVIMNPSIWDASGHTEEFTDPLVECLTCNRRFRADHLVEEALAKRGERKNVEGLTLAELEREISSKNICGPNCEGKDGETCTFSPPRKSGILSKNIEIKQAITSVSRVRLTSNFTSS